MTETLNDIRDRLNSLRETPVTSQEAATTSPPPAPTFRRTAGKVKPNIYGGYCTKCNGYVVAGAGCLGPRVAGKWTVLHTECPTAEAEFPPPVASRRSEPISVIRTVDGSDPHPGIYTVENPGGHNTFRVFVQPHDDDFMPGALLLELLTGSDNTSSYTSMGRIEGGRFIPWKKNRQVEGNEERWFQNLRVLFTNPEAVLTAKHCTLCNRVLSTPESIARGIGPDCAAK